ncbi:MAG: hypothetical protein COX57_06720 [Alphaproteobacteria bacterium CG_4_10_14_0_2_um_filter_63_37]|nr:MAG: hypothetical protein AUJ55_11525 [Proteobacteria bacterium CG1_02_64_396]PJA24778.1 MAG: hypothetical protein COX57_06720 [Alphaproteobacteria bacterium CG_4_10_14_0_2_um_filter_63_37]
MTFAPSPLRQRLTYLLAFTAVGGLFIGLGLFMLLAQWNEQERIESGLARYAAVLELEAVAVLDLNDPIAASRLLRQRLAPSPIAQAALYMADGNLLAHWGRLTPPRHAPSLGMHSFWSGVSLAETIYRDDRPIGTLYLETPRQPLGDNGATLILMVVFAAGGLIGVILWRPPLLVRRLDGVLTALHHRLAAPTKSPPPPFAPSGVAELDRLVHQADDLNRQALSGDRQQMQQTEALRRELEQSRQALEQQSRDEAVVRDSEERYRRLVEISPNAVIVHSQGIVTFANPSAARVMGVSDPAELLGRNVMDHVHPDDRPTVAERIRQAMSEDRPTELIEERLVRANGELFPAEVISTPFQFGDHRSVLVVFRDLSERRRSEEQLQRLSQYDLLTGLPNRGFFQERLEMHLAGLSKTRLRCALMMIDLDRFKVINETLSHAAGDAILAMVAQRLVECCQNTEAVVTRLGGDEFGVIQPRVRRPLEVAILAERILAALGQPFAVEGKELLLGASIGITLAPTDGEDGATLIRNAESTMYHAKERGRNNFQFFDELMNTRASKRMAIEASLRTSIKNGDFELYFEPKVALSTGKVVGVEALIRWHHPEFGMLPPVQFISIAEETGLIRPLGDWVLQRACEHAAQWDRWGWPPLRIAVNLSARQFMQDSLIESVRNAINDAGIDPGRIELELTESAVMEHGEQTISTLLQLKEMGVRLAIDDFGTGFSSLSYLKRFPLDTLKIDRSFIRDLPEDQDDAAIVTAIIQLAKALNLRVTAEGVETVEQLEMLRHQPVEEIQGFLISPPISEADLAIKLEAWNQQSPLPQA